MESNDNSQSLEKTKENDKIIEHNIDLWKSPTFLNSLGIDFSNDLEQMEKYTSFIYSSYKKETPEKDKNLLESSEKPITKVSELLDLLKIKKDETKSNDEILTLQYYEELKQTHEQFTTLLDKITSNIQHLDSLIQKTRQVSEKTNALDKMSRGFLETQTQLSAIKNEIGQRLTVFLEYSKISKQLASPSLTVGSEEFIEILQKIDEGIKFMKINDTYKDSAHYLAQYKYCQTRCVSMIKNYVTEVLSNAVQNAAVPVTSTDSSIPVSPGLESAISYYYGKFQASAHKINTIVKNVENRANPYSDYQPLLEEIQQMYVDKRYGLLRNSVSTSIQELTKLHKNDRSSLFRSCCSVFLQLSLNEYQLYYAFFTKPTIKLKEFLEKLCCILYDALRPSVIHIEHVEILCELCMILRGEMLGQCENKEAVAAFEERVSQLVQDLQERLVFRAHVYFQTDILNYKPSPGDLAYPGKLQTVQKIIMQPNNYLKRSDSRTSLKSDTNQSRNSISTETHTSDLPEMWYPTLRRTLQSLSRLHKCVDLEIFQGLSQEAVGHCVTSIVMAGGLIAKRSKPIDGYLFQIKHLLILREQIATFHVDFTIKETKLDFTHTRTAAVELLKGKQLSGSAILKFILESAPQIREQLLDSRKHVDAQLKYSCEKFIETVSYDFTVHLKDYFRMVDEFFKAHPANAQVLIKKEDWAVADNVSIIVSKTLQNIKMNLSDFLHSMSLYIFNKDTQAILFRPIKNNIIASFIHLEQLLTECAYNNDEKLLIACPTAEQVSVLLASATFVQTTEEEEEGEGEKVNEEDKDADNVDNNVNTDNSEVPNTKSYTDSI